MVKISFSINGEPTEKYDIELFCDTNSLENSVDHNFR